jgi:hypothetical protein
VNAVRDRADARWLPSRFDFALFRLFAYFRLKTTKPEPKPGLVLAIERHQSAIENYLIAICVWFVIAAFLASILASTLPLSAACLIALPAAGVLVSVEIVVMGVAVGPLVRKLFRLSDEAGVAVNSIVTGAFAFLCAVLLATGNSPLRPIGFAYLFLLAANVIASIVVFLMRGRFAALERGYELSS